MREAIRPAALLDRIGLGCAGGDTRVTYFQGHLVAWRRAGLREER
jgi:hypothetical protein